MTISAMFRIMKYRKTNSAILFLLLMLNNAIAQNTIDKIFFDGRSEQVKFAINEIQLELKEKKKIATIELIMKLQFKMPKQKEEWDWFMLKLDN